MKTIFIGLLWFFSQRAETTTNRLAVFSVCGTDEARTTTQ